MVQAKQIKLKSYPEGMPKESDFETTQTDVNEADLKQDQLLVQLVEVSVDPYLRYRMAKPKTEEAFGSYKLNETVNSIGLARVLESKSDKFKKGDIITAWSLPWQEKSIIKAEGVEKIPEVDLPLSYHLHSLGMTGLTAYFGLLSLCDPKPNEVVLVSAAAGAVGMLVGQIAKIKGSKVYGIAGGKEKVEFVKSLGFDDCLDYKSVSNMDDAIKKLCPDGIDVYFDNVGGETLDAVLLNLKMGARLSLCGSISQYNDKEEAKGPRRLFNLTTKNATMTGFLVGKWASEFGKAIQEIAKWVKEGKIKEQIDERKGFESIVPSFIDLFKGGNTGKVVVKVSE